MSIRVMSNVWENSTQKGAALLLLLAISDYANDEGTAWPAIDTLAKKIRMSRRYTQDILKDLVAAGELSIQDQEGPHTTNRYKVLTGARPASPLNQASPVLPAAKRGEARLQKGARPASPEPSLNHQEPIAAKPAAARDELFDAIAEVCRVDPATCGSSIAKVKQALLKAKPPYTSDEVKEFGIDWWTWNGRTEPPSIWKLKEQIGKVRLKQPVQSFKPGTIYQ